MNKLTMRGGEEETQQYLKSTEQSDDNVKKYLLNSFEIVELSLCDTNILLVRENFQAHTHSNRGELTSFCRSGHCDHRFFLGDVLQILESRPTEQQQLPSKDLRDLHALFASLSYLVLIFCCCCFEYINKNTL